MEKLNIGCRSCSKGFSWLVQMFFLQLPTRELTNTSKSAAKQHLPDHKEFAKINVLFIDLL